MVLVTVYGLVGGCRELNTPIYYTHTQTQGIGYLIIYSIKM